MPAIHENLKALRQSLGLTQEEVAGRLGVTRQTVSSYESGRTRPDLDTLKRLAEVYDTDIQTVLYGSGPEEKRRRRVKATAVLSLAAAAVCGLVYAIPIWISNTWFWLEEGALDGAGLALLERRNALYGVRYAGEVLDLVLARLLCLLLLDIHQEKERFSDIDYINLRINLRTKLNGLSKEALKEKLTTLFHQFLAQYFPQDTAMETYLGYVVGDIAAELRLGLEKDCLSHIV